MTKIPLKTLNEIKKKKKPETFVYFEGFGYFRPVKKFWISLVIQMVLGFFFFFFFFFKYHFIGFEGFLVILEVSGLFWSFKMFQCFCVCVCVCVCGYFSYFNGFKGILAILVISGVISLWISEVDDLASVDYQWWWMTYKKRTQSKRRPEKTGQTPSNDKVSFTRMKFQVFGNQVSGKFSPSSGSDRSFI